MVIIKNQCLQLGLMDPSEPFMYKSPVWTSDDLFLKTSTPGLETNFFTLIFIVNSQLLNMVSRPFDDNPPV